MFGGGVPPGTLNACPYSLYYGSTTPTQDLKCFASMSLYQQELFNVASNALFCVLEVWQDFILFVVQGLLSHGANFHSSKHIGNYTQDGFVSMNVVAATSQRLLVCSAVKQKHFVNNL